ncbi:MAG: hypothetical protein ABH952_04280 [Candidatus Omnitrophota bacterium]
MFIPENPHVFNTYQGAELELTFLPTAEVQEYIGPKGIPADPDFDKKYPPVKAYGVSNARGRVKLSLPPCVYRLIGLNITNKPQELLGLVLKWHPEPFNVAKGKIVKLPDLKFIQPIEIFFPKKDEAIPINSEDVEISWKPYYDAEYYKLEVRRFYEGSAKGGFNMPVHDTKIDWESLKKEILNFNKICETAPEWQVIVNPGDVYHLIVRAFDVDDKELSHSWSTFKIIK